MAYVAAIAAAQARKEREREIDREVSIQHSHLPSGSNLVDRSTRALDGRRVRLADEPHVARPEQHSQEDASAALPFDGDHPLETPAKPKGKALPPERGSLRWLQALSRERYEARAVQLGVAALIALNFVVSLAEAQLAERVTPESVRAFYAFEWFFTLAFSVELAWNLFSTWFRDFVTSGWSLFDLFIVTIAWLSLLLDNLPGISVFRLFRAFRVFRLFRRIASLRSIIEGIFDSLPGVGNAFVVLGLLMGIWAIIGCEFFGEFAPQEFGTFSRAMFTMWQVMSLDGWADIARPLIYESNAQNAVAGPIFFVSYTFVAATVMTNVVIAILLDNYLKAIERQKEERAEAEAEEQERQQQQTLEAMQQAEAEEEADAVQVLNVSDGISLAPQVVSAVLGELCRERALQRLPREELLDLAAVLYSSPVTRAILLRNAYDKVLERKAILGTAAGELMIALAAQHPVALEEAEEEEPNDEGDGGRLAPLAETSLR